MSTVAAILNTKGNTIWSVKPSATVLETLKLMSEKNVGAVLVLDGHTIAGIFSERDFARHCAQRVLDPSQIAVKDMMTSRLIFVTPSQTTDECMSLMTSKRIRHLPVKEGEQLVGLISIGDVVNRIIQDHKFSIEQLERYVTGEA